MADGFLVQQAVKHGGGAVFVTLLCGFVLAVVSRGCRGCSSFSYCRGEGEEADCECLPGYRRMKGNKCLGEDTHISVRLSSVSREDVWSGWWFCCLSVQLSAPRETATPTPSAPCRPQTSAAPANPTSRGTAGSASLRTPAWRTTAAAPPTPPSASLMDPTRWGGNSRNGPTRREPLTRTASFLLFSRLPVQLQVHVWHVTSRWQPRARLPARLRLHGHNLRPHGDLPDRLGWKSQVRRIRVEEL